MSLKEFIADEANYKCSIGELEDALGTSAKVIPYYMLEHMTLPELFERDAVIILIQSPEGNHYITLLNKGSYIEHFDSYGDHVDYLINKSGQTPFLSNLLQGHKVVMNKDRLQKMDKKINDCGRWAYVRVVLRHRSLKDFKKLFKSSLNPDEIVCLMTSLIF